MGGGGGGGGGGEGKRKVTLQRCVDVAKSNIS